MNIAINFFTKAYAVLKNFSKIPIILQKMDLITQSLGRIETDLMLLQSNHKVVNSFSKIGFKVYSQNDEDGIIQYLISKINIHNKIFVEFGVENYTESNTRFLLQNNNWSGLVIDSNIENINFIKSDPLFTVREWYAECSFITSENINEIFSKYNLNGEIGILSIDIDGNDYWIWNAITAIDPIIVIVEFNNIFGPKTNISIPYNPSFDRTIAHYTWQYYGASLNALYQLAQTKGYDLVGVNNICTNAFFVKHNYIDELRTFRPQDVWKKAVFKDAREHNGRLSLLPPEKILDILADMPVYDFSTHKITTIKDLEIDLKQ